MSVLSTLSGNDIVIVCKVKNVFEEYDIEGRKEKLRKAFACEPITCADDLSVIVATSTYFGTGERDRPREYWEDPKVMLNFQTNGYAEHLKLVDDDIVPYFMPWFDRAAKDN